MSLADDILARVYALVGPELDSVARQLHGVTWAELTQGLGWRLEDTGGGCQMLAADTPWGTRVGITDGEVSVPGDAHNYLVALTDEDGEELYAVQVRDGSVEWQGGTLA